MRWLPALVFALVLVVYGPSLGGGWTWDDHYLLERNPALSEPARLWSTDVWSPSTGEPSDLYRPLVMTSYWPGQRLWPGPTSARLGNLALHLLGVGLVAALARQQGASVRAAWLAAAIFGVHAGNTEAVAWITGRHDLLPAVMMLGAFLLLPARPLLAGGLCAATALAKEPYMLAPVALGCWAWGRGRWSWSAMGLACAGPLVTVAARALAGVSLPIGAAATEPVAAVGALVARGATLLVLPGHADAAPLYRGSAIIGSITSVVLVISAVAALRGRRSLALGLAPAALLLPAAPASAQIGLVADRYFYLSFAVLAALLARFGERVPAARWLWALVPLLAWGGAERAATWRSDVSVWAASVERDPSNPYAAFHLGHALHVHEGDCARAVPLYERSIALERRARTNLMACLNELKRYDQAAATGPGLAAMDPTDPKVPASTARALVALGRLDEAAAWATRAVDAAGRPEDLVLLGNIAGQRGDLDAAERAFQAALARDPGLSGAHAGLRAVEARRGAGAVVP